MNNSTTRRRRLLPWMIWGLAAAFYFYEFFLQVSPSVMVPELMRDFSVGAAALGVFSSIYFWAYSSMQIPVGMLLDRFGPRRLLTIASAICAAGGLIFAASQTLFVAEIGRLFIGFGSAFVIIGCMKLMTIWFPVDRFAFLLGLTVTIGMLGAIFGESPFALMIGKLGWRQSMYILGFIGIAMSVAIYLVIRDRTPEQREAKQQTPKISARDLFDGLKQVLRNGQVWMAAVYGGLMYAPTLTFAGLWGVPYLMLKYDLTRPGAAAMVSTIFVGWAVGSPLCGWISDRIGRRLPTMIAGAFFATTTLLLIIYAPKLSFITLHISMFLFGLFSSGFLTAFSIVRESTSQQYAATALGFMNMMNMIGIALAQPLIGFLLDMNWDGTIEAGVRVYSIGNYHFALAMLPSITVVALLLLPFIKETYCRTPENRG